MPTVEELNNMAGLTPAVDEAAATPATTNAGNMAGAPAWRQEYIPGTNFLRSRLPDVSGTDVPNNYEQAQPVRDAYAESLIAARDYGRLDEGLASMFGYAPDPLGNADPETRKNASIERLKQISGQIRNEARNSYYTRQSDFSSFSDGIRGIANPGGQVSAYGMKVGADEIYNLTRTGRLIPRTRVYTLGINNEEALARKQTGREKAWNGVRKLAAKTAINFVGGTAGVAYGVGYAISELASGRGKWSNIFDNSFTDYLEDLNQMTDFKLPHYYTEEEKNASAFNRIFSLNGFWNDMVGNGLSFIFGAMLSVAATGGLGIATLPARFARLGMGMAARWRSAATGVKATLGALKRGAAIGRGAGNTLRTGVNLLTGAGYESSVEAYSYIKESEQRFKDYMEATTGQSPTVADLAAFRKSNEGAANLVFLANLGTVGLSHFSLLGKYSGLGSTFLGEGMQRMAGKGRKFIDNKLFGLGARRSTTAPGTFEAIKANRLQKTLRTSYNVLKRPFSEGVFEEGLQGVYQNAAKEYIDSQYNKAGLKQQVDLWTAVKDGFAEQYTSDEGWTEIGIGALLGAAFGVRSGFGLLEGGQRARAYSELVDSYNANHAYSPEHLDQMARTMMLVNQQAAENERGTKLSNLSVGANDDVYTKLAVSDRMGMLDEHIQDFNDAIDNLDVGSIAKELDMEETDAADFKAQMKDDFKRKVKLYKASRDFAADVLGETARSSYGGYVAQTFFSGMDSRDNIEALSKLLSNHISYSGMENSFMTAGKLERRTLNIAKRIKDLDGRIESLDREAQGAVVRGDATDSQKADMAERIRKATEEREKLVRERQELLDRLGRSGNLDYNKNTFGERVKKLLGDPDKVTAEDVLAAYDSLQALDDYLASPEARDSADARTAKALATLYKENVTNYKNAINLAEALRNKRFLDANYRRFRAIEDNARKQYLKIDTRDRTLRGSILDEDGKIDTMLANKEITEEEAFSMKFLNHLRDKISDTEGTERFSEETVTDDDYGRYMQDDAEGNRVPLSAYDLSQIADRVESPEENGFLSPRQRDIYDRYKDVVDHEIEERGSGVKRALSRLTRLGRMLQEEQRPHTLLGNVKDMLYDDASEADKKELDNLEEEYRRARSGESNPDEAEDIRTRLNKKAQDLGLSGDYSDLVDRDMEDNGDESVSNPDAEIQEEAPGQEEVVMDEEGNPQPFGNNGEAAPVSPLPEVQPGEQAGGEGAVEGIRDGSNVPYAEVQPSVQPQPVNLPSAAEEDAAEGARGGRNRRGRNANGTGSISYKPKFMSVNPFAAMCKRVANNSGGYYEIHLISPKKFLQQIFGDEVEVPDRDGEFSISGYSFHRVGDKLRVPRSTAEQLADRGIYFPNADGYNFVLRDQGDGNPSYIESGEKYGQEGHSIDQKAASEVQAGTVVQFRLDKGDSYNKNLKDEDYARSARIEIWDKDGKLLLGLVPEGTSSNMPSVREGLLEKAQSVGENGVVYLGTGKVTSVHQSAPIIEAERTPVADGGRFRDSITGYGYVEYKEGGDRDGEYTVYDKDGNKVKLEGANIPPHKSFMRSVSKEAKRGRNYFVMVKQADGSSFAYPVSIDVAQSGGQVSAENLRTAMLGTELPFNPDNIGNSMGIRFDVRVEQQNAPETGEGTREERQETREERQETHQGGQEIHQEGQETHEERQGAREEKWVPTDENPVKWDKGLNSSHKVYKTGDYFPDRINDHVPQSFPQWVAKLIGFGHITLSMGRNKKGRAEKGSFLAAWLDRDHGGFGEMSELKISTHKGEPGHDFKSITGKKEPRRMTIDDFYEAVMASEVPAVVEFRDNAFKGMNEEQRKQFLAFQVRNILTATGLPSDGRMNYSKYALAIWYINQTGEIRDDTKVFKKVSDMLKSWEEGSRGKVEEDIRKFQVESVDLSGEQRAALIQSSNSVDEALSALPEDTSTEEAYDKLVEFGLSMPDGERKLAFLDNLGDMISIESANDNISIEFAKKAKDEINSVLYGRRTRNNIAESEGGNINEAPVIEAGDRGGIVEAGDGRGQAETGTPRDGGDRITAPDGRAVAMEEAREANMEDSPAEVLPGSTRQEVDPEAGSVSQGIDDGIKGQVNEELNKKCE